MSLAQRSCAGVASAPTRHLLGSTMAQKRLLSALLVSVLCMVHVAQSLGDFRTPVGAFGNRGGSGSNPRCTAAVGSLPRAAFIGSALGRTEDPPTDPLARLKNALGVNVTPGVLGRFMAVLWLHPLDTLRTRAQVVAFSLVMLNVDAHNDNIKRERKMSLSQVRVASRLRASRCTLMLLAALADVR